MTDGMTLKESIANEKRKWKEMNGKQKLSYYKTYYLIPTIILVVVLAFVINVILDVTVRKKTPIFSIITVNMHDEQDIVGKISEELLNYLDGNEKKEEIAINEQFYSENGDTTTMMVLQANVAANSVDAMIMDESAYKAFGDLGCFEQLDKLLTDEEFSEWEDRMIYLDYSDEEISITYPAAIDISGTSFAKRYYPLQDTVYLSAIINGDNVDRFKEFLDFVAME